METCSICLEEGDKKFLKKTSCNHYFHHKCLEEWYNIKNICPVCRKDLIEERVGHFYPSEKIEYSDFINVMEKNHFIFNHLINSNDLINTSHSCELTYDFSVKRLPLYKISRSIYITSYLRTIMIFGHFDAWKIKYMKDRNGFTYICTDQEYPYFNKKILDTLIACAYDIVVNLSRTLYFNWRWTFINMISDFTVKTIIELDLKFKSFPAAVLASIYNTIKFHESNDKSLEKEDLNIEDYQKIKNYLIYFSAPYTDNNEVDDMIKYQETWVENIKDKNIGWWENLVNTVNELF